LTFSPLFGATIATGALLLAWDLYGFDLALSEAMGGASGFPMRSDWLLNTAMHTGAKYAAWAFEVFLCAMVVWPRGPFATLTPSRRLQLATTVIVAAGLVSALKSFSHTSCPWDLREFGGVATHLSHWQGWLEPDGGAGRCFPAGHASSGFAFLGGFFAFRQAGPRIAKAWLAGALIAGVVLGVCQQLRGAHFLSHTLWTGWICWATAWATDRWFTARANGQGGVA
jgi:membrane-associated PAP2 superfamily phosphatase